MRSTLLRIGLAVLVLSVTCASALAQERGRGREKRNAVFNGYDQRNGRVDRRGNNQNWKCSVFVNCHDARDGRVDGRGQRVSRSNSFSRGDRVSYRRRYNTNDYWNRRHVAYVNNGRYRNRTWRDR